MGTACVLRACAVFTPLSCNARLRLVLSFLPTPPLICITLQPLQDRVRIEAEALAAEAAVCPAHVPALYHYDARMCVIAMQVRTHRGCVPCLLASRLPSCVCLRVPVAREGQASGVAAGVRGAPAQSVLRPPPPARPRRSTCRRRTSSFERAWWRGAPTLCWPPTWPPSWPSRSSTPPCWRCPRTSCGARLPAQPPPFASATVATRAPRARPCPPSDAMSPHLPRCLPRRANIARFTNTEMCRLSEQARAACDCTGWDGWPWSAALPPKPLAAHQCTPLPPLHPPPTSVLPRRSSSQTPTTPPSSTATPPPSSTARWRRCAPTAPPAWPPAASRPSSRRSSRRSCTATCTAAASWPRVGGWEGGWRMRVHAGMDGGGGSRARERSRRDARSRPPAALPLFSLCLHSDPLALQTPPPT